VADVSVTADEKVKGEVVSVLYGEHIRELRREGRWFAARRCALRRADSLAGRRSST